MDTNGEQGTPDYGAVFELCADMERTLAALYRHLAKLHRDREDLRRLWTKTACEEDNHAQQFSLARSTAADVAELRVTADQAAGLLKGCQTVLAEVEREQPAPIEALERAVRLEHQLARFHMTGVAEFTQPNVRKLFAAMAAADREHIAALERQLQAERQGS